MGRDSELISSPAHHGWDCGISEQIRKELEILSVKIPCPPQFIGG
jgi:hypothetical protein